MAKLIIDKTDYGIQAFVVQLRSFENHRRLKGIECGDIGTKLGFLSQDNGYVKFTQHRIPRLNMLMKHANVSVDGKFEKTGNDVIMYASMLLLRASLCVYGNLLLTNSTTIAIRYSAVRHQTANEKGYRA